MEQKKFGRAFSLIEIMVVIAIILALTSIGLISLSAMNDRLVLNSAANDLVFTLEEMRASSVAGKGGEPHGVYFAENSYTEFSGDFYEEGAEGNFTHQLAPRLAIETDTIEDDASVIFSRITGEVDEVINITISLEDNLEKQRIITVGLRGDISQN